MTLTDLLCSSAVQAAEAALLRDALIEWGDAGIGAYIHACDRDGTAKADAYAAIAMLGELRAELVAQGMFNLQGIEPPEV